MKNPSTPKTMDEYIARYPKDVQEVLEKIRNTIHKGAPEALEMVGETLRHALDTLALGSAIAARFFLPVVAIYRELTPPGTSLASWYGRKVTDLMVRTRPDLR